MEEQPIVGLANKNLNFDAKHFKNEDKTDNEPDDEFYNPLKDKS